MVPLLISSSLALFGVAVGLAWPVTRRISLDPLEQLLATVALSLLGVYLFAFAVFAARLPIALLAGVPALAAFNLVFQRRSLGTAFTNTDVRGAIAGQILICVWCMGWLGLILSYSGGGWIGDWFGHWQRAQFFLENGPRNVMFNGFDPLPSRPPLVNVVTAAFLARPGGPFAQYQLVVTLLATLVFLPAALLARRFGGRRAIAVLTVLLMMNPLFVQNATFTWTKLPTAFFVLTAIYFFLRAHDSEPSRFAAILCGVSMGAAILAHYSAVPYAVLLAAAWFTRGAKRWRDGAWWRATVLAFISCGAVLATWFGWALAVYGATATFLTNTSATERMPTLAMQAATGLLNLRDTLVPHFLRHVDFSLFAQRSASGFCRDWFFLLYQVNLPLAFGSLAWFVIIVALARAWRDVPACRRTFWGAFLVGVILLGTFVHTARDTWGLVHICLQPIVVLGLAFLAAHWSRFNRGWRGVLIVGGSFDLAVGISLQFGVESALVDRWLKPATSTFENLFGLSAFAQMNLRAKLQEHWIFFGDLVMPHVWVACLILAGALATAVYRVIRSASASSRPVAEHIANSAC
jgi:4-amino-4-deoxy-L-arabinose transferase-like glycosyltransferase